MRICKSFGDMRSLPPQLRATCPQPIINSSQFGRPKSLSRNNRINETPELKAETSVYGDRSLMLNSVGRNSVIRPLFVMDLSNEDDEAAIRSSERIPVIPEDPKKDSSLPIPVSLLTHSFLQWRKKDRSATSVPCSAPLPVPKQRLKVSNEECEFVASPVEFIPPHEFAQRSETWDQTVKTISSKGLSTLRLRDAVLEQIGYYDGYNETSQNPESKRES